MITKILDQHSIALIPEEPDDLITLRRIIKKGDRIVGDTTRIIKLEKDYSRPDKGERIRIRIGLDVEKVSLDNVLDRLRIHGIIIESNNEYVPKGSHHSFMIVMNESFKLIKKQWIPLEKKLLQTNNQNVGFLLVALDTSVCGIGRLKGTHLQIMPNIYSGSSGKQYKTNFNIESFFESIQKAIISLLNKGDEIIIFGPGETKKRFSNFLQKTSIGNEYKNQVIDGIDSGGEDGLYTFTKSQSMKEIMSDSKLAKVLSIIDEIMLRANKKSRKFTMGFGETLKASQYGAIESLVFSEKIIQTEDEEKVIELLNDVESKGAKVYGADSTTDAGLRVSGLGGIVSLLRFALEY
ncbi:MAG: mRNA surveillance protein pelota [Nitrosopumilaceae archaeon]